MLAENKTFRKVSSLSQIVHKTCISNVANLNVTSNTPDVWINLPQAITDATSAFIKWETVKGHPCVFLTRRRLVPSAPTQLGHAVRARPCGRSRWPRCIAGRCPARRRRGRRLWSDRREVDTRFRSNQRQIGGGRVAGKRQIGSRDGRNGKIICFSLK